MDFRCHGHGKWPSTGMVHRAHGLGWRAGCLFSDLKSETLQFAMESVHRADVRGVACSLPIFILRSPIFRKRMYAPECVVPESGCLFHEMGLYNPLYVFLAFEGRRLSR
jgi:hypothetical protein